MTNSDPGSSQLRRLVIFPCALAGVLALPSVGGRLTEALTGSGVLRVQVLQACVSGREATILPFKNQILGDWERGKGLGWVIKCAFLDYRMA